MNRAETKLDRIEAELISSQTCPALAIHVMKIVREIDIMQIPETLGDTLYWGIEVWTKAKPLGLHNQISTTLCRAHKINDEQKIEVIKSLELLSIIYCFYITYPMVLPELSAELKKLKKISSAARKLRDLLPKSDSDLIGLLKIIDNVERQSYDNNNTDQFFSNLSTNLQTLENMKDVIPKTVFGQLTKINSQSPKGHIAIRIWIISIYNIWTETLGRSFKYDGADGLNGVLRFTDFAFDTLLPLHPSIEHAQIDYAVRAFRNQSEYAHALLKPKS